MNGLSDNDGHDASSSDREEVPFSRGGGGGIKRGEVTFSRDGGGGIKNPQGEQPM